MERAKVPKSCLRQPDRDVVGDYVLYGIPSTQYSLLSASVSESRFGRGEVNATPRDLTGDEFGHECESSEAEPWVEVVLVSSGRTLHDGRSARCGRADHPAPPVLT